MRRAWVVAGTVAVIATAIPAAANDENSAVRGAARLLAEQGDEKLHAGRFEEALQLFRMAEELFHAPTLVLAMAQAERKLGRWADARKHYKEVIADDLGPKPQQAFVTAKAIAREELAALEPKIPRLIIEVAARPETIEVRLDGKALPVEALDGPLYVDVGKHEVMLIAGDVVRVAHLEIEAEEEERLRFDMSPDRGEQGLARNEPQGLPWYWPVGAFALGTAGLVVGAVTGALALDDAEALRATCLQGNQGCDPAARSLESSANDLATISTVGFVVGGVGVATGIALLIVDRMDEPENAVSLRVGPTKMVLEGRF
jgi:tetratricopeptide (TPR) repeat protein